MKDISEYTPEELQRIGKTTVLSRQKQALKDQEKNEVLKKAWALYKEGKLKI